MKKNEKTKLIEALSMVIICVAGVIFGMMRYAEGVKNDDAMMATTGVSLALMLLILLMKYNQVRERAILSEEIEELRVDLALLQNRCDWIEDNICKEYRIEPESYTKNLGETCSETEEKNPINIVN